MKRRLALFFGLLAALAQASAAAGWALGAEPVAFTLDNGLSVVLQRDEAAPITVVQLLVRCGDRDDPPGKQGLAYLTARLCLEITDSSKLQQLMDLGSSYSLEVAGGHSLFTIRSLSRGLEPTLDVLIDMLLDPLFSDLRVDGVKNWMRLMREAESDDPLSFMRRAAAAAFYERPAHGAALFGDSESLGRIGRRDIQAFYRSRFLAGNMVAVVVSDLPEAQLRPLLARQLGRITAGRGEPSSAVLPRRSQPPEHAEERRTAQALVSFTTMLPELGADSLVLASLLESWLGKGIASRLWQLRSRGGLAYGLAAEVRPNPEAMLLSVYLKTEAARAAGARMDLQRVLEDAAKGVDEVELASAKAYAKAAFLRENEMRESRSALMAFLEGSGLSWRLAGEFASRLDQVTVEGFNLFLKAALAPEHRFFLRVGPPVGTGGK